MEKTEKTTDEEEEDEGEVRAEKTEKTTEEDEEEEVVKSANSEKITGVGGGGGIRGRGGG